MATTTETMHNGWISIQNAKSRYLTGPKPCAVCHVVKHQMIWYNVKIKQVRCRKCFTPEGV